MIGSKPRMPKRARYPIFLAGLTVILLAGLGLMRIGSPEPTTGIAVVIGLALMAGSVILK